MTFCFELSCCDSHILDRSLELTSLPCQVSSNSFLFRESENLTPTIPLLESTAMLILRMDPHFSKLKSLRAASAEDSLSRRGPKLPSEYVS